MFNQILASKKPLVGGTKFIAVDGRGGSGKTTVANMLARKLSAEIIHTDDFASWEEPINWWPRVIKVVFEPIARGDRRGTPVMILEGVSALRREFRPYISLGVFIDTPREICLKRGVERDLASGAGKTKEEIIEMWNGWAKDEDEYLDRDNPQAYADIVVDGTRPFEDRIH